MRTKPVDELIDKTEGCWLWLGTITPNGYGIYHYKGTRQSAHRAVYETKVGPIPEGFVIDHLCRNRACVNPDHLEPVTQKTNVNRGNQMILKTHCIRGHLRADPNLYYHRLKDGRLKRLCRACQLQRTNPSGQRSG